MYKGKAFTLHVIKAYMGSGDITPLVPNLGRTR